MTREDFVSKLVSRFTESIKKNMPSFDEVQETEYSNVFICRQNDSYYFATIISPSEPIISIRKAQKEEIIKENE